MGPSGPTVSECSWLATGVPASVVVAGRDCDEPIPVLSSARRGSEAAGRDWHNNRADRVASPADSSWNPRQCRASVSPDCEGSQGTSGVPDHVKHNVWVGQHWNVAAGHLGDLPVHALGGGSFEIGVDALVIRSHDVPARLVPPGRSFNLRAEQGCGWGAGSRPDNLLLLLGQVAGEVFDAFRKHPDASVLNLDRLEHFRLRELVLLSLQGFSLIGPERVDVHE